MIIHNMVIIMYKIHHINIYYKLKYGLFLDNSLTAMRYYYFIGLIKLRFVHVNSDDHLHISLLWPQILLIKLTRPGKPSADYMGFHMGPLLSIFQSGAIFRINLNKGLFRPF